MHLRIYIWLFCVALAGNVRATEDVAAVVHPTEIEVHIQHDGPLASDKDLFIDDDGSGLEVDESSGSGFGPGPDDEDGRGSARILFGGPGEVDPRGAGVDLPSHPDSGDINLSGDIIDQSPEGSNLEPQQRPADNGVLIMDPAHEDRAASFFSQPGILAAVIGGAVVGLLCAILVVMFIVYRMRKKDEGSYALDEPKRSPAAASYGKGHNNREFYA
ncbi:syndecan isoform X2 [Leptidea sinapis]|uniref:syndecan isoform X2 n=1 Tax=Leptidea sinapis TaxID=189913 RepID=UPI0021C430F0|nr:syndecan isoform X2 [Leptidea sinapis]